MAAILGLAAFFLLLLLLLLLRTAWDAFCCYFLVPKRIQKEMAKQGISGPPPRFLIGNLLDIASMVSKTTVSDMPFISHDIVPRLLPHYLVWVKQYGAQFVYWYGSEPRICLTETDMVKEFLSSKNTHTSGRSWLQLQGSKQLIGGGLIMANGEEWYHQRHIVAPAFLGDRLKGFMGCIVECTNQMLRSLRDSVETSGNELEIGEYMTRLTGDVISRAGFGSSYEKGRKIFQLLNKLQHLTAQSSRYLWFPGNRFLPSKFKSEIKTVKKNVDRLLMEIVQSRKDSMEIGRSSSYGSDLLGLLLSEVEKKREGFNLTLQLLMDECKTAYFAGHESTALLLTWTVMLLATNPSWQERARAEVLDVCQGQPPSTDQLTKLTTLHMIINESLRLYPPVAMLPRMAFEDIKLGDSLRVPKGLSVWIPVLAIHHSKKLWGDDADEFNPGRWVGKSFAQLRHFLPFAAGPRNCVGQAFAMMEAKVVLAMFLAKFSFTISENYRHAPVNVLTLKPKHGVPISLRPLDGT